MGALFGSSSPSPTPPPPPPPPPAATPPTYASSAVQAGGRKAPAKPMAGTEQGGADRDIIAQTPTAKKELLGA